MASFSYSAAFMALSLVRGMILILNFHFLDIILVQIPILVFMFLFNLWCSLSPLVAIKLINSYRTFFKTQSTFLHYKTNDLNHSLFVFQLFENGLMEPQIAV